MGCHIGEYFNLKRYKNHSPDQIQNKHQYNTAYWSLFLLISTKSNTARFGLWIGFVKESNRLVAYQFINQRVQQKQQVKITLQSPHVL